MNTKGVLIVVLVAVLFVVVMQNTQVTTFQFFFWPIAMSRILLLIMFALIGFVVGILIYPLVSKRDRGTTRKNR